MAVQKSKKSRSKSGMRRGSHAKIPAPTLSINSQTGQHHRRHHLEADGSYRGVQYLVKNKEVEAPEEVAAE